MKRLIIDTIKPNPAPRKKTTEAMSPMRYPFDLFLPNTIPNAIPPIRTAELAMLPMMNTAWLAARLSSPASGSAVRR